MSPPGGRPPAPPPQPAALWRPLAGRPAAGSEGPDDPLLRGAVLAVHGSAMLALVVAGVLAAPLALLAFLVAVGLSLLARACLVRPSLGTLRIGLWTAVAGATLVLPFVVGGLRGAGPAAVLGVFVAGFLAATSADQDGTRRAMLMNLVLGVAVLALGVGLGPFLRPASTSALVVPVAVGWACALVALARAARRVPLTGAPAGGAPAASSGPSSGTGTLTGPPVVRVEGPRVPRWRSTAGVVALTMAVSLLAFGLLSRLPDSPSAGSDGSGFDGFGGLGGGEPGQQAAPRSLDGTYSGGSLDLRSRGTLPDTPVMYVAADSPTLWRSAVLDTYTGATWAQPDLFGPGSRPATGTVDVTVGSDPAVDGAPARTDTVRWVASGPFTLPRPGTARTVTVPRSDVVLRAEDGTLVHPHGGRGSRSDDEVDYTVDWLARPSVEAGDGSGSPVTPDRLRAAAPVRPGGSPLAGDPTGEDAARWLQRAGTETDRTAALAQRLVAGAATRYDAVRAVEDHLRETTRYTLAAPVPGEGEDAVDDFLFDSREGFCEQYASAEVVLLRLAGVPARLAVGFSGGTLADGADAYPGEEGLRLVRESDAHAWVEVWFPGYGWVASDPTAGSQLAAPAGVDRLTAWAKEHVVLLVALAVVLALLVAAVAWLVLRRRGPAAAAAPAAPRRSAAGAELVAAYGRLEAALDRSGGARRPAETLAELGDRLARGDDRLRAALADGVALPDAVHPDAPPPGAPPGTPAVSSGEALAVLERLLYAAVPPAPGELHAAAAALDAATTRVLAAERLPEPAPAG